MSFEGPRDSYPDRWYSDRVFKVFMGLTTAPAMAFALDYLVHDAFSISDHSIVVTVAGIGSVSGGNRRLRRHPMAQAKLGHVQLPPLTTAAQRLSEAITRVAPLDAGHVFWLASFLGDEPVASRRA